MLAARPRFLPSARPRNAHSPATRTANSRSGSIFAQAWLALARLGIRKTFPPLRLIDSQSAEIARKRARYSHPRSKGAETLTRAQYRRTHELLRGRG